MQTDYKILEARKDDLGNYTYAKVRFFEGDTTAQDEPNIEGEMSSVMRYRRSGALKDTIYQPREFKAAGGNITTESGLRTFLNDQLALDKTRTPITQQTNA